MKYLGIVDGSMGVLSRKMALLSYNQARNQHKGISTMPSSSMGKPKVHTQVPHLISGQGAVGAHSSLSRDERKSIG